MAKWLTSVGELTLKRGYCSVDNVMFLSRVRGRTQTLWPRGSSFSLRDPDKDLKSPLFHMTSEALTRASYKWPFLLLPREWERGMHSLPIIKYGSIFSGLHSIQHLSSYRIRSHILYWQNIPQLVWQLEWTRMVPISLYVWMLGSHLVELFGREK